MFQALRNRVPDRLQLRPTVYVIPINKFHFEYETPKCWIAQLQGSFRSQAKVRFHFGSILSVGACSIAIDGIFGLPIALALPTNMTIVQPTGVSAMTVATLSTSSHQATVLRAENPQFFRVQTPVSSRIEDAPKELQQEEFRARWWRAEEWEAR